MKKFFLPILLILLMISPGFTQDKKKKDKFGDKVYYEKTLENFETTKYTDKNLKYRISRGQDGSLSIRDQYPAPLGKSKKYLGVKIKGKHGDYYQIIPEKELIINKYCKSIAVWVYGKRFSGELSILLQDAMKQNHRLVLGNLNFLGWRKLIVKMNPNIKQEDEYLNQKRVMRIMQIQYRPANINIHPKWQYFYIDDISAMVRDKYTDRQSDDW
jgi:hypothetical protein